VAKVLQIRRVGADRVLRLALGGEVLQTPKALLQLAQTLRILEGIRFGSVLRADVWAVPRIGASFPISERLVL